MNLFAKKEILSNKANLFETLADIISDERLLSFRSVCLEGKYSLLSNLYSCSIFSPFQSLNYCVYPKLGRCKVTINQ